MAWAEHIQMHDLSSVFISQILITKGFGLEVITLSDQIQIYPLYNGSE